MYTFSISSRGNTVVIASRPQSGGAESDTPGMTARALVRYARHHGWRFVRAGKGSHAIYAHPNLPYKIAIPNHGSKDISRGTLEVILKQIDGTWRSKS
jgi:predicted RNA binding protein YcfA (HicA-like mRNA interferase family)